MRRLYILVAIVFVVGSWCFLPAKFALIITGAAVGIYASVWAGGK